MTGHDQQSQPAVTDYNVRMNRKALSVSRKMEMWLKIEHLIRY